MTRGLSCDSPGSRSSSRWLYDITYRGDRPRARESGRRNPRSCCDGSPELSHSWAYLVPYQWPDGHPHR